MILCTKCQKEIKFSTKYCVHCGETLHQPVITKKYRTRNIIYCFYGLVIFNTLWTFLWAVNPGQIFPHGSFIDIERLFAAIFSFTLTISQILYWLIMVNRYDYPTKIKFFDFFIATKYIFIYFIYLIFK
jgi:hypothetical protein